MALFETRMSEWTRALTAICSEVLLVSKSRTVIALFEILVMGWTEASVAMYLLGALLMKKSEMATASLKTRISGSEVVRCRVRCC